MKWSVRFAHLEIEREALKREKDKKKVAEIEVQIADLDEERKRLRSHWETEKGIIDQIREVKEQVEQLKVEADQAERNADFGKVAEIRYGKVAKAEERIVALKQELQDISRTCAC